MKKLLTHLLLLSILMAPTHAFSQEERRIGQIELTGLKNISEQTVRNVLPLSPGDAFEIERIDQAVNYLRKWGVFDAIQLRIDTSGKEVVLHFQLDEATVISQVDISGNYPYVENKIRKYLTVHAGDIYTPKLVQDQVERVETFYQREGYVNTSVAIDESPRPEVNGVDLTFHIHRGTPLRYHRIDVTGNKAYPDGRFVSTLNPYKPYSEQRLRSALRDLSDFYHARGYPKAKIKIEEKKIDFEKMRVNLALSVHEGPYVKVDFKGNRVIRDRTLRETITIFREASFDAYEIEASQRAILKSYAARGFPDAKVEVEQKEESSEKVLIQFLIQEGEPQSTKKIRFRGNNKVSSKTLQRGLINHGPSTGKYGSFSPSKIDDDTRQIKKSLRQEGFLEGEVGTWQIETSRDGFAKVITIPIEEGSQTIVHKIIFSGNNALPDEKLLKELSLKTEKPYNPTILDDERQKLLVAYSDHGHPYAEIRQEISIDKEHALAEVTYEINEGVPVTIGEILIIGDILTSQKAIKKAMTLKSGDPFSTRKLLESQLNIRRLGPFAAVNIETIGLTEKEEIVHLRVKVEEERPFLVDLEFGYSTDEAYTGSLRFTNRNAFGWAKRNTLTLTGGSELTRAELGWIDPRFFNSNFELSLNSWIQYKQEPAFTYIQLAGASGWFRRFRYVALLFRVELDRNYFVEGSSAAADAASLRNNTIVKTSASVSFDTRDSFADPRKGIFLLGTSDLFNEIKGKQANFTKLSLSAEYDISPFRWLTFSSAARFNRIQTIGSNISIPSNELLFLGGDDTIRGFEEDSIGPMNAAGVAIGGRTRWIINEELRFRVTRRFGVAAFYDAGQLTRGLDDLSFGEVRHSAGFGFRYVTPVGPIRADYGWNLHRRAGEPGNRFHLTFGYVF